MADTTYEKMKTKAKSLLPAIFRRWVHSREEDTGDVEVFRPADFGFPPSFGRDGFEMERDGQFNQDDIGPADGTVQTVGRWVVTGPDQVVVVSFEGTDREGYSFEIVAVDESVLKIRRVNLPPGPERYISVRSADDDQLNDYIELPPAVSFRRLDFDSATIITLRSFPPQFILRVSGTLPYATMKAELVPLVYIQQPEYWGIEVVGSLRGIALPVETPYAVSLPLTGFIGSLGIEVIGASRSEQFDIGPLAGQGQCSNWAAWVDSQPPGPPTLHVTGECEFPTAGFSVTLVPRVPQGINPRDLLLDKIVEPPPGLAADVVTKVDVHYTQQEPNPLDTVTILPDGPTIPVQQVE